MPIEVLITFILASFVVVIVPGPMVTVIIANGIRYGARAGLMNVAGSQLGLAVVLAVLVAGLNTLMQTMGWWFDWLRLAGAAYLIYLGIKMIRAGGEIGDVAVDDSKGRPNFFLQGFLVMLSNPKALLFYGAFIPQFLNTDSSVVGQTIFLGVVFMIVGATFDSLYALMAGQAGNWLSRSRIRLTQRISGAFLVGGGVWLALARR
ncbi:MAG: LysE family translocator [Pseudomonadota bacterium]